MAFTAASSAPSLSPLPIHRAAAIAAASVTRTSSMARFRSGDFVSLITTPNLYNPNATSGVATKRSITVETSLFLNIQFSTR